MNKVFASKKFFIPIREDNSRIIISYTYAEESDGINATWYEIYINKKKKLSLTFNEICNIIIDDINNRTDEKILNGFVWTCLKGEDKDKVFNVWLSSENLFNFKAAYDLAVQTEGASLPVKFKIGEHDEILLSESPTEERIKVIDYHTFKDMEDFTDFYSKAIAYVNQCLNEGWIEKDNLNFELYKKSLETFE